MSTNVARPGAGTVIQDAWSPPPDACAKVWSEAIEAIRVHSAGLAVDADEIATNARNSEAMKTRQCFMLVSFVWSFSLSARRLSTSRVGRPSEGEAHAR